MRRDATGLERMKRVTQALSPRPHPPPTPSAAFLTPASSCRSAAGSWSASLPLGPAAGWSSGPLPSRVWPRPGAPAPGERSVGAAGLAGLGWGGGGAGSQRARGMGPMGSCSAPSVSHHASDLSVTPASHTVHWLSKSQHVPNLRLSRCPLMYCLSVSQQALSRHLTWCPLLPVNHQALDMRPGPSIPPCGELHPLIHNTLYLY